MYRSAELSKFEKVNLEHSTTGSIQPSRRARSIDKGSAKVIQGLAVAVATSGTLVLAGTALIVQ